MAALAIGVQQVSCPICRARVGRPCVNVRGYLLERGAHRDRIAAWAQLEQQEFAAL